MARRRSIVKGWDLPPKKAKRVWQGRIFSVYQWPQRMYDGRHVTHEAVWRPASVNVVAIVGDKVLMTRERNPGIPWYWGLPGGRASQGERPLHAAKRELLEETGYVSNDWTVLGRERAWSVSRWMSYWYLARSCRKVSDQDLSPNEVVEVHLVDLDEFLRRFTDYVGSIITDFTEMKYDTRMKEAFAKKAFGRRAKR